MCKGVVFKSTAITFNKRIISIKQKQHYCAIPFSNYNRSNNTFHTTRRCRPSYRRPSYRTVSSSSTNDKNENNISSAFPNVSIPNFTAKDFKIYLESHMDKTTKDMINSLNELFDDVSQDLDISKEDAHRYMLGIPFLATVHKKKFKLSPLTGEDRKPLSDLTVDASTKTAVLDGYRFSKFALAAYGAYGEDINILKQKIKEETRKSKRNAILSSIKHLIQIKEDDSTNQSVPQMKRRMSKEERDILERWFIADHTGIEIDDIMKVKMDDTVGSRAYFIAVDHISKSVILSIRGTMSAQDALVDIVCDTCDFLHGKAHRGIAISSSYLFNEILSEQILYQTMQANKGYSLVVTGHSLGAATSLLLTLMLQTQEDKILKSFQGYVNTDKKIKIRCFAFAPPPVCSENLLDSWQNNDKYEIISYVNRHDIVTRSSLMASYRLFSNLQRVDKIPVGQHHRMRYLVESHLFAPKTEDINLLRTADEITEILDISRQKDNLINAFSRSKTKSEFSRPLKKRDTINNGMSNKEEEEQNVGEESAGKRIEKISFSRPLKKSMDKSKDVQLYEDDSAYLKSIKSSLENYQNELFKQKDSLSDSVNSKVQGVLSDIEAKKQLVVDDLNAVNEGLQNIQDEVGIIQSKLDRINKDLKNASKEDLLSAGFDLHFGKDLSNKRVTELIEGCESEENRDIFLKAGSVLPDEIFIPGDIYWLRHNGFDSIDPKNKHKTPIHQQKVKDVVIQPISPKNLRKMILTPNAIFDHSADDYEAVLKTLQEEIIPPVVVEEKKWWQW